MCAIASAILRAMLPAGNTGAMAPTRRETALAIASH